MTNNEIAQYAAQAWAQAHAKNYYGSSVKFGTDVMNVYLAANDNQQPKESV